MKYHVLGCSNFGVKTDGYFDRICLHETDSYGEAKSWLTGYVRFNGLEQSGYQCIAIRDNQTGNFQSQFDRYGWTHF